MYSRWTPPACIGKITIKRNLPPYIYTCGHLSCTSFDKETWFVFNRHTMIVEAIFYSKPNVHGWSASEAHAKSYVLNADKSWSPFELDAVP